MKANDNDNTILYSLYIELHMPDSIKGEHYKRIYFGAYLTRGEAMLVFANWQKSWPNDRYEIIEKVLHAFPKAMAV